MDQNTQTSIKTLQDFWQEVLNVWNHGFMGINISNILTALAIFFFFLLLRGIFSKYVLSKLQDIAKKSNSKLDDKIFEALIPPIRFVPVILGIFFASNYLNVSENITDIIARVEKSLIAFTIFWGIYRTIEPFSHGLKNLNKALTPTMMQWLYKVLRVLISFIGGAVILEIWGIQVGPLLAGLGLFGAAVALGAQDLFKNLIAGVTIIAEKRFCAGEWIKVDGVVEGTVEDIGFRSTKVRRFDKAPVHVPNALLSDAAITNFTRMTHRRIYWKIGVTYSTTTEQLKIIRDEIIQHIENNDNFSPKEEVSTFVRIDSFNDSSIDFMIYCFTKTTKWGEWLSIKEDFALKIKEIVEDIAGSSFAFPSQSIYVEQWPAGTPETFAPPAKTKKKTA